MARNHVLISGTGRCGTSFLVELLTNLELDTGFYSQDIDEHRYPIARAGLEHDIRQPDCPYIVKSPWFCDHADDVIERDDIVIEHLFIPIRDLAGAAESRRHVVKETISSWPLIKRIKYKIWPHVVGGGLWHTHSQEPGAQEHVLSQQVYKLVLAVSKKSIPVTILHYPKLVRDPEYLYEKLSPILAHVRYETFEKAFNKTVRPDWIHSFNDNDR
jgi:hypothetical protein